MALLINVIIFSIIFLISLVVFITRSKGSDVKNKKAILFTLLFAFIISVTGALAYAPALVSTAGFILFQVIFLGLGYLQTFLAKRGWYGVIQDKIMKVAFIAMNASAGIVGFTFIFGLIGGHDLAPYFSLSGVIFVLPQFSAIAFESYINIPEEIYKVWYYPLDADEIDFEHIDTSVVYMIELEYSKNISDNRLLNSKVRAPLGMRFGDWFRSFIENYNERYDSDPIHYKDADDMPYGWIFYVKPPFLGTAKYVDPELTITENKLTEKRKIIAKRVAVS